MALPVSIPNTFANATTSIPLANLDANFTTIYAAVNGIGNGAETLANVQVSGGTLSNVTITNLTADGTVDMANATAATIANANITSGNVTVTTVADQYGNVRTIAAVSGEKTTEYTLVKADVGRYVTIGSGGSINITDDVFVAGDAVSLFNNTNAAANIVCTITTAYIAGTDTDVASANLATRGVATVLFTSNVACVIAGNVE